MAAVIAMMMSCQGGQKGKDPVTDGTETYTPDLTTIEGQWRDEVRTKWMSAYRNKEIRIGSNTMRIWWKVFGDKPADGHSLYISLHGGGGTDPASNDQQWDNQKTLYQPAEGVYLCPRAITNTWDLHFRPESDAFYEAIIQMAVAFLDVNPDKVYLMGYSAGGDGVYAIAPRMADRFAGVNMSSGHPNSVSLLNTSSLPFLIQVGIRDYYSEDAMRSVRGAEFEDTLNGYHEQYGSDK
jgi:poly(3-hydroxybutyrate) depolymerase